MKGWSAVRRCAEQWRPTALSEVSPETFGPVLVISKLQSSTFTVFTCANSDTIWHWIVSCTAAGEQTRIMAGINEFHMRTTMRLVRHNSPPSGDYIHITGENSGCWSYVGRIGGVSNTVQGVVKTNRALRTALVGFRHTKPPPPTQK
jgi:hypothetical protein